MTASDDAKFERASREAPTRWVASIVRDMPVQNDEEPPPEGDGSESMEAPGESPGTDEI